RLSHRRCEERNGDRLMRDTFHPVGVGYYPNGVHVHLDVDRVHDAYWIDAGDAPTPADSHAPLVAGGDLSPDSIDARGDEPVMEVPSPGEPAARMAFDPPAEDPGIPQ